RWSPLVGGKPARVVLDGNDAIARHDALAKTLSLDGPVVMAGVGREDPEEDQVLAVARVDCAMRPARRYVDDGPRRHLRHVPFTLRRLHHHAPAPAQAVVD